MQLRTHLISGVKYIVISILLGLLITTSFILSIDKWGFKGISFPFIILFMVIIILFLFLSPIKHTLNTIIFSFPILLRLNVSTTLSIKLWGLKIPPSFLFLSILFILIIIKILYSSIKYNSFVSHFRLFLFLYIFSAIIATIFAKAINTNVSYNVLIYSLWGQIILPSIIFISVFYSTETYKDTLIFLRNIYWSYIIASIIFYPSLTGKTIIEIFLRRPSFFYTGPNVFAAVSLMFFPIGLYFYHINKKLIYIISSLLIAINIGISLSRGGIAGLLLEILLIILIVPRFRKTMIIISIITGIVSSILFYKIIFALMIRFQNITTRSRITENSTLLRIYAWKVSLKGLLKYPIGIGGNQFPYLWQQYSPLKNITLKHSHNFILGTAIEYGIISAVGILGIFIKTIGNLIKTAKKHPENMLLVIGLIGFLVSATFSEGPRCHIKNNGTILITAYSLMFVALSLITKIGILWRKKESY